MDYSNLKLKEERKLNETRYFMKFSPNRYLNIILKFLKQGHKVLLHRLKCEMQSVSIY